MKTAVLLTCLSAFGLLEGMAHADELRPFQSGTFHLRNHIASVYYLQHGDDFRVVTTLAPTIDRTGAPMRFASVLQNGQEQTLSIGGFGAGVQPTALRIRCKDNVITADLVATTALVIPLGSTSWNRSRKMVMTFPRQAI